MHHYNILLTLDGDKRDTISAFIVGKKAPLRATIRKFCSMRLANIE